MNLSSLFKKAATPDTLREALADAQGRRDAALAAFDKSPSDANRQAYEAARTDIELAQDRLARAEAIEATKAAEQAAKERAALVKRYKALRGKEFAYKDDPRVASAGEALELFLLAAKALVDIEHERTRDLAELQSLAAVLTPEEMGVEVPEDLGTSAVRERLMDMHSTIINSTVAHQLAVLLQREKGPRHSGLGAHVHRIAGTMLPAYVRSAI
jgi:hypothetical protein